jgi:V/A-type H+-transporting ATPase subunit I
MFFPKAMSEIELIVPSKDLLRVTQVLSGHGVFHQVGAGDSGLQSASGPGGTWQEKSSVFAVLERRLQNLMQTVNIATSPTSSDFQDVLEVEAVAPKLDIIEHEIKQITDRLAGQKKRLEQLQSDLRQLEPVAGVDLKLSSLGDSHFVFSVLGVMPADNVSRLQTSLARVPHLFLTLREDAKKPVVWLAGTQSNSDVLERAAGSAYLERLSLPTEYGGTPPEVMTSLRGEIDRLGQEISESERTLAQSARLHTQELLRLASQIHAGRVLTDAIARFGRLRHTYIMVGWVPTEDLPSLTRRVKQVSSETLIESVPASRIGDKTNVPVALQQSRFLRPFQLLVTTYARPRYGELDPTWLIALTFPLLFGAMFGDVGHGVLLALFGILISARKIKFLNSLASLGGLITACGILSTIFGFLYGSMFGFENILSAIWLRPGKDPLQILMVAVGAGIILLTLGFLIGIFNLIISQDWPHLLFGHSGIAGISFYLSLLSLVAVRLRILRLPLMVFVVTAVASALIIMLSELLINLATGERPLVEGGVGTYAIQAPMELLEVLISSVSNSLSYVRVGAFAIAHVVLSSVVFLLAELVSPGHGVGYWIVVAVGTVFIVGYEGLIVGIQAMRLSYYELFSKFFTGGGMQFEPLTLAPTPHE